MLIRLTACAGLLFGQVACEPRSDAPRDDQRAGAQRLEPRWQEDVAALGPPPACELLRSSEDERDAGDWLAAFSAPEGARLLEWRAIERRSRRRAPSGSESAAFEPDHPLITEAQAWTGAGRCTVYGRVWPVVTDTYPVLNRALVRWLGESWLQRAKLETVPAERVDALLHVTRLGCHVWEDEADVVQADTAISLLERGLEGLRHGRGGAEGVPVEVRDDTLRWCERNRALLDEQIGFVVDVACRAAAPGGGGLKERFRPARNMVLSDRELATLAVLSRTAAARGVEVEALRTLQLVARFAVEEHQREIAAGELAAARAGSDVVKSPIADYLLRSEASRPDCLMQVGGSGRSHDATGSSSGVL